MAIFKNNKTYIKKYASNNFDKKIKFAPDISAEFGSGGNEVSPRSAENTAPVVKTKPLKTPEEYSVEIKFAEKKVSERARRMQSKVISGPVGIKVLPVEKPDLTFAQADEYVRPVIDGKVKMPPPKKEEKIETPPESTAEESADTKLYPAEKPYKMVEPQKAPVKEKTTPVAVTERPVYKPERIKSEEKRKRNYEKDTYSEGFSTLTTIIILILSAALGVGVYFAYERISEIREEKRLLEAELSVMYAPEEYIYPQTPPEIEAKVQAAKEEAQRVAAENAYVSKRAEVPGLFKSDYEKVCYLTFDDGPTPGVTDSILNTLARYGVPATFFVVGKNADANPNLIKRIDAEGHSIGNHSYSHDYDYMYSGDEGFDDETKKCKAAINNALGREYENLLYRFPGGSFEVYKHFYIYNIESEGYQYADWNALTGDSETQNPDEEYIMNKIKETTNNGSKEDIIVLMHDTGAKQITADTLPQVIEYLKSKNYVFKAINNSNYVPNSAQ